jgi:hypothetical protein
MNKKIKNNPVIIFCLLLLCFTGCKTKQHPVSDLPKQTKDKEEIISEFSTPKIIPLNYQWLSYRINLLYKDYDSKKEKISASAFFVNKKDSVIYLTISKLGIEGIRVVVTPDSVKFLNHLNSSYYSGDYSFLEKMLGFKVNFYLLQAIFLGEDVPGFDVNFLYSKDNDIHVYTSTSRKNKTMNLTVSQTLKINSDSKIVENNITELSVQSSVNMRYWDFIPFENHYFFQQAEIIIPKENILLEFKLRNLKINEPGPTSIRIPLKYTPIKIE